MWVVWAPRILCVVQVIPMNTRIIHVSTLFLQLLKERKHVPVNISCEDRGKCVSFSAYRHPEAATQWPHHHLGSEAKSYHWCETSCSHLWGGSQPQSIVRPGSQCFQEVTFGTPSGSERPRLAVTTKINLAGELLDSTAPCHRVRQSLYPHETALIQTILHLFIPHLMKLMCI